MLIFGFLVFGIAGTATFFESLEPGFCRRTWCLLTQRPPTPKE
jgi:hypothetical protein